jgi:hypothetical protein
MTDLASLEEHNKRHGALYNYTNSRGNGIACPECGWELLDSNPSEMLLSNPPQFRVHCSFCDYHGTRF